ncbi:MAG: family 43 glycosylhydrolase [Cytophagales bacterium]|nr:family 43 glycosylhydrolase [Armatimonadota bacterium]
MQTQNPATPVPVAEPCFVPGQVWNDTNGEPINAHGGGLLYHEGVYYWYGEFKIAEPEGNKAQVGVSCYSSSNLYHWGNEGIALPVSEDPHHDLARGCILERPKVLFNRATGKFVMWFHLELLGEGYQSARVGIAVSDSPTGPFAFRESFRPDGAMSRDLTLFVDDDAAAYLFTASEDNRTLHISRLTDDYLQTSGEHTQAFPGRYMEAPAVFRHGGRYWFVGSGCTGWAPNAARSAVADRPFGPWEELDNPCVGPDAETTFSAQSTYVLPVAGRPDTFLFLADRWTPDNPIEGRYVWLPITFTEGRFQIPWRDTWDLNESR